MRTGPLDQIHRDLGAKMAPFAGWEMPISYAGTVSEHRSVRERVGIFDVSHLGKFRVRGPEAARMLDEQLTNRMLGLKPGRARYSLICTPDGGIVDDLIVYAIDDEDFLVVPNASNVEVVAERFGGSEVLDHCTIAVQGPRATDVVGAWFPPAKDLGYMRVASDGDLIVSRSGYTGEKGFEVFAPAAQAPAIWDALHAAVVDAGGEPCGLGARDTLRLEMGYPLHGNDIDVETTPFEAGLGWAVALTDRSFVGSDALRSAQPRKSLVGITMLDRVIPRRGCAVVVGGEPVGSVTSGTFSPILKIGIALAFVPPGATSVGDEVLVDVRGKTGRGLIVEPPFVEASPK